MDVLKAAVLLSIPFIAGCQIPYIAHTAYNQAKLFSRRVPVQKVIEDPKTEDATKSKLKLVLEARAFAGNKLGLDSTENYSKFVQLDGPYVTYIVHAAPKFELESYQWWFPIVGKVPYKGYFNKEMARDAAKGFDPGQYDTFVRGVTAFSTLGWFSDPLYSSMIAYSEHDLVNTVIHETVHATIYFKNKGHLNERMATFLGDYGTELFYQEKEGADSPTIRKIRAEQEDQKLFSQFLSKEMKDLRSWYASLKGQRPIDERTKRLDEIQKRFVTELKTKMKTEQFASFAREPLNNARLLAAGTYYEDLTDFERLRAKLGPDFKALVAYLKNLSKSSDPERELRAFVSGP